MSLEKVGEGFGSLRADNQNEYYTSIFTGTEILLFSLAYAPQPTHNFGHHVFHKGSYVLSFNLETKEWRRIEFPALNEDENIEEHLFVHDGKAYALLFTNFDDLKLQKLFRWSGDGFEEVPLEAPPAESHPQERLCFIVADGSTSDGKRVIVSSQNHVYTFDIQKDGAKAEFVHTVPEEVNRMRGKALSAAVIEDKVVISYGVHGCGFMWQNGFLLIVDLKEKSSKNVEVELDCDSPNFCAIGAKAHALLSNGDWIHAVGSIRQGMTGSLYDGKTFALVDALTKPRWAKLGVEVPEDEKSQVVIDPATNTVYVASTNAVSKASLI